MKDKRWVATSIAACSIATMAMLPLAAHAVSVDECRALVGFNGTGIQLSGAGAVVLSQHDQFLSNNIISSCEVKYVQPSTKAKPPTITLILAGPMRKDECSMYRYLSSIDSALGQGKFAQAYTVSTDLNAKVDDLRNTGMLSESGWTNIKTATAPITTCVTSLISQ